MSAELLVVAAETGEREIDADDAGFLGAGEQPRVGAAGAADRDGLRILQVIGLIGPHRADQIGREPRLQLRAGVGQQRRGPVLVGDAEPAVGDLEADRLGVVDFLVAVFLQALVAEIADQAFVQDVIARDLRGAVPRDQRERIQRDRRIADIGDVILDGEEIALVDRNGAAEGEALAIVIFQRHRARRRQAARAFLLPQRFAVGEPYGRAGRRQPSRIRRNRARRARGREQHDRGRFGIDGVAELHQRQIVDARALQRNAAGKARGVDLDARAGGNRGIAGDDRCRRCGRIWRRRIGRRRGRSAGLWRGRRGGRSRRGPRAWPFRSGPAARRAAFPSAARCRNIASRSARGRTE